MTGKQILLVEDSSRVISFNKRLLEGRGFAVDSAMTLAQARESVKRRMPDAIILDIGMPDGSGLSFLQELRQTSKVPVLLLTGFDEDDDVIAGFESGCDDYLPKPYTFGVLLVRLQHLLQNTDKMPETIAKGRLRLKIPPMIALVDSVDLLLSQKEFALLLLFVNHENRALASEYIYEQVWGQPMAGSTGAVRFQISRLRKKISGSGYTIVFKQGAGYCFERE